MRATEAIVSGPPSPTGLYLLYGANRGLALMHMHKLGRALGGERTEATAQEVVDGKLMEAGGQTSLFGTEPPVVVVREVRDNMVRALEKFLVEPSCAVVVMAGVLRPAAKIRQLAEKHAQAWALPCYPDGMREREALVRAWVQETSLHADRETIHWMVAHMGEDRALNMNELTRLALYMEEGTTTLAMEDVMACMGDATTVSLDALVDAALMGERQALARAQQRLTAENILPSAWLMALARHALRLYETQRGGAVSWFPARRREVERQARVWRVAALADTIAVMRRALAQSRYLANDAICAHAVLAVAHRARQLQS